MTRTWRDGALCAQVGTWLFFPEQGGSLARPKRVCARCPVRGECLTDALAQDDQWGVRGGLSEIERRALHAEWRRTHVA